MNLEVVARKHGYDVYMFFRRRKIHIDEQLIEQINRKTIREAAAVLGEDTISFLIFLGYLKRVGIVKEVRIR